MDKEQALNNLFEKAHEGLDLLAVTASKMLDDVVTKADDFLEQVEAETRRRLADGAVKSGEPVKVEPSEQQMREDLKAHRRNEGGSAIAASIWDSPNVTSSAVRQYWMNLPENAKTWDIKDKNSPI